ADEWGRLTFQDKKSFMLPKQSYFYTRQKECDKNRYTADECIQELAIHEAEWAHIRLEKEKGAPSDRVRDDVARLKARAIELDRKYWMGIVRVAPDWPNTLATDDPAPDFLS
ncbi:MAG: hypothetical protein JO019_02720, partial [Candidatus Kaiserbacteria bacterium]|nr:hypothetical protein [Candidatus Kaiserbacteria bacterium]